MHRKDMGIDRTRNVENYGIVQMRVMKNHIAHCHLYNVGMENEADLCLCYIFLST